MRTLKLDKRRNAIYPCSDASRDDGKFLVISVMCTQDDEKTDKDGGQSSHAQPQYLLLLHQLAVGSGVAGGTEAGEPLSVVPVDAGPSVMAGIVQTLVTVLTTFPVRCDSLAPGTPGGPDRVSLITLSSPSPHTLC